MQELQYAVEHVLAHAEKNGEVHHTESRYFSNFLPSFSNWGSWGPETQPVTPTQPAAPTQSVTPTQPVHRDFPRKTDRRARPTGLPNEMEQNEIRGFSLSFHFI